MKHKQLNLRRSGFIIFFLMLLSCPVLLNLGERPLTMWDESREAVNALEMCLDGHWLVTYFDGQPDYWNTKPPLMVWTIAGFMKLIGYNAWAVRLPSALAGLAVFLVLMVFSMHYLKDIKTGWWASLILVGSSGFVGHHVIRTGDTDALLVLFITSGSILYFLYLNRSRVKDPLIFWSICLFALGFFTKSIAGFLSLPGLLIYTLVVKKIKKPFTDPWFYRGIVLAVLLIAGFLVSRDFLTPGYLKAMIKNDLTGRYLSSLEGHGAGFFYYFKHLAWALEDQFQPGRFFPWVLLLPLSVVYNFFSDQRTRTFHLFCLINAGVFLLVISFSQTKMAWYDAPAYPFLALILALSISDLWNKLFNQWKIYTFWKRSTMLGIFTIIVFGYPYYMQIKKFANPKQYQWKPVKYEGYFKHLEKVHPEIKKVSVVTDYFYYAHLYFYQRVRELDGWTIRRKGSTESFVPGEMIINCKLSGKEIHRLKENYQLKKVDESNGCGTFRITGFR